MSIAQKGLNFLLYSNIYIGLCASCLVVATYLLFSVPVDWIFTLFVFLGTLAQYSWHRWIGLKRIEHPTGRFLIVKRLKTVIFYTACISTLLSGVVFWLLPLNQQLLMLIPCLLAALYVLPVLPGNNRLRDLPYIKIFVVSFTWTLITSAIPLSSFGMEISSLTFHALNLERFLFIFAITIPFDIRDSKIDPTQDCITLVTRFGVSRSKYLAYMLLTIGWIIWLSLRNFDFLFFVGVSCIYLLTFILIYQSSREKPDWYFLLFVDGTMILFLFNAWLNS